VHEGLGAGDAGCVVTRAVCWSERRRLAGAVQVDRARPPLVVKVSSQ
jgi:hypothetical protein